MLNQIPSLQLRKRKCSLKSIPCEKYLQKPLLDNRLRLLVWFLFVPLVTTQDKKTHGFSCFLAVILTGFLCSAGSSRRIHKQRKLEKICVEKFISTSQLLKSCSQSRMLQINTVMMASSGVRKCLKCHILFTACLIQQNYSCLKNSLLLTVCLFVQ